MKRVAVVGALGRMGERVRAALDADVNAELAGALEAPGHAGLGSEITPGVVVSDDPSSAFKACDVVIDFSVPSATLANLAVAADAGVAYVTGTTGFDAAGRAEIADQAARIPVVHAPNFSVAVNVLAWLVREASRKLGPDYDAELFEIHHSAKRDAPSGTALLLAEAVAQGRETDLSDHLRLQRAGEIGARPEGEIGVAALRGGDNSGEHSVYFVGGGERIELVHRAHTRDHFARGAVRAAGWVVGRAPGLHRIEEMLGL
jgi:4-hydroxy-tetrahydrodipicolinate reductase